MNTGLPATACCRTRAVTRCSRVLNYDLARWVTELRPQLQAKQHSLILEIDDAPLPPVLCDRMQLRQVLVNLVTGAHTYTDTGGRITVAAHATGRFVRIEVTDTGARVGSGGRGRGFEPFARSIIEAHGGSIAVQIQARCGSRFGFTIPVHRERTRALDCSAA